MSSFPKALAVLLSSSMASFSASGADFTLHSFETIRLNPHFWSEGASFGDFNRDGQGDVVSGPFWYEGPDFRRRHEYYPATRTFDRKGPDGTAEKIPGFEGALGVNNAYSDNFFAFVHDFNDDEWPDILIVGFPGKETAWYQNPRKQSGSWLRHVVYEPTDNESPTFEDLTGDGRPELICNSKGTFGYAEPDWSDPRRPWTFHPITPEGKWQRFTHGLGVGDVNGDGRKDLLEMNGWWEQPESLSSDPEWRHHPYPFAPGGSSQMYAYDVDGDGDNDVITCLAAHGYGVAWYEQLEEDGAITFRPHVFVNKEPEENRYGVRFSQPHAVDLADIDGDGLKDVITGKRFWAHGAHGDAEPNAPAVLYWFKLVRGADGEIDFIPHLIHDDSGIGTQVVAGDINGDGLPDVVVGNKKGTFVHLHRTRKVTRDQWEKAQPKPLAAAEQPNPPKPARAGIRPNGEDGRPLNLGLESGDLRDWKAEGAAFRGQPVRGDRVSSRRSDMQSQHQGDYWIGGYEIGGDDLQGTLTSEAFKVTQPFASFLIAGGPWAETRVEVVDADSGQVIFKSSGSETENLRPVVVDLQKHLGKSIFVRLVDKRSGHWGHINFDDFLFHEEKPQFANALNPERKPIDEMPPVDVVKFAGLSGEQAAKESSAPPGFSMTLFAGEPDVRQPIAFAIDDRGRIWVAEAYTYPRRAPEGQGKDRIVVFEDTDGDGKFNNRTVFIENLNLVSGLEVGFGGVWVGAAPYLMFIPDRNGDSRPDSEPQIVLDGWAWQDTHETLNTFCWGPDGWLYGCHGVFTHSNVGQPGAPDDERTQINAGIWRYHPTREVFEVFAEGTSNPWGIDFDERGRCIIEACVIPHLFHMVQGGRFHRQAGSHFNTHTYADIKTVGDHVHFGGNRGPHAGNNRSDAAGGGHAHAGLMVYLGDSWPESYRGQYFMNNIHGQRINMDIPVDHGSGIVGRHGPDFVNFNDRWSQILNLLYDHNGSVYMIDWYDANQCHHGNEAGHDRSNGRILKLVYQNQPWTPVDLAALSDAELVELQLHKNDWYVRHARRLLQERAHSREIDRGAQQALVRILRTHPDETRKLRALWALHVTGGLSETLALGQLESGSPFVRAWAVQLLAEDRAPSPVVMKRFAALAASDPSPVVRLYLASALQRTPVDRRWEILSALVAHGEDAEDHNLPLMYWYAAEPGVGQDVQRAVRLLSQTQIPQVREFIARRMALAGAVASAE